MTAVTPQKQSGRAIRPKPQNRDPNKRDINPPNGLHHLHKTEPKQHGSVIMHGTKIPTTLYRRKQFNQTQDTQPKNNKDNKENNKTKGQQKGGRKQNIQKQKEQQKEGNKKGNTNNNN